MTDTHPEIFAIGDEMHAAARRIGDSKNAAKKLHPVYEYGARLTHSLTTLQQLRELRLDVDARLREIELEAARDARKKGARWQDIAEVTGITRQSAQVTYGVRENKPRAVRRPRPVAKTETKTTINAEPVQDFETDFYEPEYNPNDYDPKFFEPD